jgi:energy-coupling factor transporter ATP-binding protein EcfA2
MPGEPRAETPAASPSGSGAANPFIGLRRFDIEDSDRFSGRDEQTHELLRRLRMLHFVAVLGPSGCGKSSLIRAGVLAALRGGYLLGEEDDDWQIVITQPGNGPLEAWQRDLQPVKRAGAADDRLLYDPVPAIDTSKGPVVVLVDQFEELFQFVERTGRQQDARQYIAALLALGAAGGRIYAILTMRSEYLAHCAQHPLLAEAINEGLYLVPHMRPEQLHDAVVRPVHQAGAAISTDLVDRLLRDVTGETDGLPILQHALMRMWSAKKPFEPMGLDAYAGERGLSAFISDHAEQVYEKLKPAEQQCAEQLFRAITELGPQGRAVRRPLEVDEIARRTGMDKTLLASVISKFQEAGFLIVTPSPRTASPLVDISHEAIARQWWRLGPGRQEAGQLVEGWITKEDRSRRWLRQIEEAAAQYQESGMNRAFLYRGLQLTLAEKATEGRRHQLSPGAEGFLRASRKREDLAWFVSKKFLVPLTVGLLAVAALTYTLNTFRKGEQAAVAQAKQADTQLQQEKERSLEAVTLARDSSAPPTPSPVVGSELRPRVYIQIRDESQRGLAQEIQKKLRDLKTVLVPGIELLPVGPNRTEVRCFDPSDVEMAKLVTSVVKLAAPELPAPKWQLVQLKVTTKARPKHIELWLAPPASPRVPPGG